MLRRCFWIVPMMMLAGCGQMASSVEYAPAASPSSRDALKGSLFGSDLEVMSNETIARILDSTVVLPQQSRIIVLRFGPADVEYHWYYWRWASPEAAQLEQGTLDGLLEELRGSPRVASASLLPSMLAPPSQSVPYLRQAAARCQADLVLLYRASHHTYEKQRAFARDKVRAYCVVEAALIDVRTGIIPFSSTAVRDYTAEKSSKDINFEETVQIAQIKAQAEALEKISREMAGFLASVPPREEETAQGG